MDNKKVEQVLKEIFDRCGTEVVQNRKKFMGAVFDLLDEWNYKDERTVLKLAMESNAIPILLSASPVTSDSAERAVEQIRKDMHMDSADAKFVVQCVVAACGYNLDIVTENEKRRQEEEAERKRKEEEERKWREEEQKRQEEEQKRREEERRQQEEERKRREEEQRRQEEERKQREEEQRRKEEERKRREEEQRRQDEERRKREEERRHEEQKRQEEERKQREEEQKRQEEERKQQEEQNHQAMDDKKPRVNFLIVFLSIPSVMYGYIGIMSWILGKGADDDIAALVMQGGIVAVCQFFLLAKTSKKMLAAWIGIVIGLIGIGCLFMIL